MHGGRSTGPRTEAGRARIAAARTIHGHYGAEWRARDRSTLSFAHRSRVYLAALRYRDWLPPEFAARLAQDPPELRMPPYTTVGISLAEDRALRRAEAVSLAPWQRAIALARQAGRPSRVSDGASSAAASPVSRQAAAEPHAPIPHGRTWGSAVGRMCRDCDKTAQEAHAPERAAITPARPTTFAAIPPAEPLAPASSAGARGDRAARSIAQAEPHAPGQRADSIMRALAAAAALPSQAARPFAPGRTLAGVQPPRLAGRNLRRWLRRHGGRHQAPAGTHPSHPLPQDRAEC